VEEDEFCSDTSGSVAIQDQKQLDWTAMGRSIQDYNDSDKKEIGHEKMV